MKNSNEGSMKPANAQLPLNSTDGGVEEDEMLRLLSDAGPFIYVNPGVIARSLGISGMSLPAFITRSRLSPQTLWRILTYTPVSQAEVRALAEALEALPDGRAIERSLISSARFLSAEDRASEAKGLLGGREIS